MCSMSCKTRGSGTPEKGLGIRLGKSFRINRTAPSFQGKDVATGSGLLANPHREIRKGRKSWIQTTTGWSRQPSRRGGGLLRTSPRSTFRQWGGSTNPDIGGKKDFTQDRRNRSGEGRLNVFGRGFRAETINESKRGIFRPNLAEHHRNQGGTLAANCLVRGWRRKKYISLNRATSGDGERPANIVWSGHTSEKLCRVALHPRHVKVQWRRGGLGSSPQRRLRKCEGRQARGFRRRPVFF